MTFRDQMLGADLHRELLADRVGGDEPGAVVAVYRNGELIASACAGVTDTETGEPLTERSLLNIASVSKQIAAATILLAERDGAIDLDADVRALVPELRLPGITVRHCLQHTAGLPDYFAAADVTGAEILDIAALDAFVAWLGTVDRADFAPGEDASYSNTGFVVAALATERATGVEFPELVRRSVFEPLGMSRSRVARVLGETAPGLAISFSTTESGRIREGMGIGEVDPVRGVNGYGEVLTSLEDFARWHGFLADGRVLGADIRARLLTRATLADGRVSTYGLGIEHERRGDTVACAHSGSMWGYRAYSLSDPVTGLGVAFFANRDDLDAAETAWRAFRLANGAGRVSGPWFSERHAFGLRLRVLANGDLEASEGAEKVRLARDGDARWRNDDDLSLVQFADGHLVAAVWFGLSRRFGRLDEPGEHPAHLLGTYREPFHGSLLLIEEEASLRLVISGGEARPVVPYGRRAGEWIGRVGDAWLLASTEPGGAVRYGIGTLLVDLERVAP